MTSEGDRRGKRPRCTCYFTDAASLARVEAIGAALAGQPPDSAAVNGAVMEVGVATCHRCHLVHVPAAFAKSVARH